MDQVNMLRAILVVMAAGAGIVAAAQGFWTAAIVLHVGVVAHGIHFWQQSRDKAAAAAPPAA